MLGVGRLPPPPPPSSICHCHLSIKHFFIHPRLQLQRRNGFCLFAQKKQQNSSFGKTELKRQDFDDEFEVDEDEDEYDEFDEDLDDVDDGVDVEDEMLVPYEKMDAWLERKPKGFGEGKVYDTSIEDKLLEELEKIREAQVANANKLKNEAKVPEPNKELKEVKVCEVVPGCVRVRVNNLPKKKNIHRDLKSAFKGVHGIANILPMVSGTKKTRDPVCKGFVFVDFKSLEDANRFVQLFSGQSLAFGKTEKRIKCEILKSSDDSIVGSVPARYTSISESRITVLEEEGDQVDDIGELDPQLNSWEDDVFDELDEDSDDEDIVGNIELLNSKENSDIESTESRLLKQSVGSLPTKQRQKVVAKNKPVASRKPDNAKKVEVLGSANPQLDSWEDAVFDALDEDSEDEDIEVNIELLNSKEKIDIESLESRLLKQSLGSLPTKERERSVVKNKPAVKKKPDNVKKVKVPGSANPQLDSWEDAIFDELDEDSDDEDIVVNIELLNSKEKIDIESLESRLLKKSLDSSPTKQREKSVGKNKPVDKNIPDNATKVKVPGSSNRLKVHERYNSVPESIITALVDEQYQDDAIGEDDPRSDSWEDDDFDELDENSDDEDIVGNFDLLNPMEESDIESVESSPPKKSSVSLSTKQTEKRAGKKKPAAKKKPDNTTKLKIPGSAKRLKVHEKAKLADVFSRYGVRRETLASKDM